MSLIGLFDNSESTIVVVGEGSAGTNNGGWMGSCIKDGGVDQK